MSSTTVLIADCGKASLVMSSEVFKDKIPGSTVIVASSGKQVLEILKTNNPDMCVIDFDLPDVDGVTLVSYMRTTYKGPILLTAYPDNVVKGAVDADLFAFNDAGGWIAKPVKEEDLGAKIDRFLIERQRLGKRFDFSLKAQVIGKAEGRGKRAPKVMGNLVNMSLGGACIQLDVPAKISKEEEVLVAIPLPSNPKSAAATLANAKARRAQELKAAQEAMAAKGKVNKKNGKKTKGKKAAPPRPLKSLSRADAPETKLRATIAWTDRTKKMAGLKFDRLTDAQKKGVEQLLRAAINMVEVDAQ